MKKKKVWIPLLIILSLSTWFFIKRFSQLLKSKIGELNIKRNEQNLLKILKGFKYSNLLFQTKFMIRIYP